ncbi:MAG TPA: PEP-CTERM sorting domain-containing protein [Phycisphaerae bacterium]|nr:PEP-CTERM sorting domain-containing protein [Phycisphaerae bacterium]
MDRKYSVAIVGLVVIGLCAGQAFAAWIPGDGAKIVRIDASQNGKAGYLQFVFTPGAPIDGVWTWRLPSGQQNREIKAGSEVLATLEDLLLEIDTDPAVTLSFAVVAGGAPTTFTISTATVPFPAIVNPLAYATAAITVTDNDSNGASATGLYPGAKAYQARYNSPAVPWANLVSTVTALPDSSAVGTERQPASGRQTILATVDRIEAEFKFTLSANDQASGTSRFDIIIPEPAALGVFGLGVLFLLRRR